MKIELKDKTLPRNDKGDVCFTHLGGLMWQHEGLEGMTTNPPTPGVLDVFGIGEVVELINRALYQMEYQKESHKKRGALERAKMKAIKEEMKKAGLKPLKGELQ